MGRNNNRGVTTSRRAPKTMGRRVKRKSCLLCKDKVEWIDYKDLGLLRKYMSDRGKIRSRRVTGTCAQHQREIAMAIKVARELVLLPYSQRMVAEKPGARSPQAEGMDDLRATLEDVTNDGIPPAYVDDAVEFTAEAAALAEYAEFAASSETPKSEGEGE